MILAWMRKHLEEAREDGLMNLINMYGVGEVNTTLLAEECTFSSGLFSTEEQDVILDDETHAVWDHAIDAAEEYERKYNNQGDETC